MDATRVERHCVNKNNPLYTLIDDYSFKSKNLYNYANYLTRQTFIITSMIDKDKEINREQQVFLNLINTKVDEFNYKK